MKKQWFSEKPISRKGEKSKWFTRVKRKVYSGKSKFQKIEIFDTYDFGRMLVLDGWIQLSQKDEFIYHEMIVHPAMFYHPNPKKVLIIGGGDGGVLREVLKYPIKEVFLDDIDKKVIEISKKYLPFVSKGALEDERVKIFVEDGLKFIKKFKNYFDVIIIDATDPRPRDIATKLFSPSFFEDAKKALKKEGILITQSGWFSERFSKKARKNIKKVFPFSKVHRAHISCFPFDEHSFTLGSKKINLEKVSFREIEKRFKKLKIKTKYYSPEIHFASTVSPRFFKK